MKLRVIKILAFSLLVSTLSCLSSEKSILKEPTSKGSNIFTILDIYKTKSPDSNIEGISYIFLVSSTSQANEVPSLDELRDFNINGMSYREGTKAKLGKYFEPRTVIFGVDDFVNRHRPDLKKFVADIPQKSIIMATAIYGAPLPRDGTVDTEVSIGWVPSLTSNAPTQTYAFRADISNLNHVYFIDKTTPNQAQKNALRPVSRFLLLPGNSSRPETKNTGPIPVWSRPLGRDGACGNALRC